MSPSSPFVDPKTGSLDVNRILAEAVPLAKLIGLVALFALGPYVVALLLGPRFPLSGVFVLATQFILAVGSGLVLMYIISRAVQIAGD